MISSTRQKLLRVLAELSEFMPDVRLGQLVINLSVLAGGPSNGSVWDVEDEEMLKAAQKHLERWRARYGVPVPASVELDMASVSPPQVANP
jgi:hypothetical protein